MNQNEGQTHRNAEPVHLKAESENGEGLKATVNHHVWPKLFTKSKQPQKKLQFTKQGFKFENTINFQLSRADIEVTIKKSTTKTEIKHS